MHTAVKLCGLKIAVFLKMFATTQYATRYLVNVIIAASHRTNRVEQSGPRGTLEKVHDNAIYE